MTEPSRIYAIGDIHGHLDKLVALHGLIDRDRARHGDGPIVHIGDLVDRGPDSKGVIDYLIQGIEAGEDWIVLKGNHDRMMSRFLQDPPARDPRLRAEYSWMHPALGGWETLASYGVDMARKVPEIHRAACATVPPAHREFLSGLAVMYKAAGLIFVHAGLRPGVALEDQTEDDLIWIRDEFHMSLDDHGGLVVHGHTPIEAVTHYGNRINLDTGAAYGGPLSGVVFEGGEVFQITGDGRRPIRPLAR